MGGAIDHVNEDREDPRSLPYGMHYQSFVTETAATVRQLTARELVGRLLPGPAAQWGPAGIQERQDARQVIGRAKVGGNGSLTSRRGKRRDCWPSTQFSHQPIEYLGSERRHPSSP